MSKDKIIDKIRVLYSMQQWRGAQKEWDEVESFLLDNIKNNEWKNINEEPIPKDPLIKIVRWNIIHKCEVTVFYYPKQNEKMPWVTGDLSHCWPEETFSPYWKLVSRPPIEDYEYLKDNLDCIRSKTFPPCLDGKSVKEYIEEVK